MYSFNSFGQIMAGGLNTVSGPFHPFGGAVDIIVVKQEDGSFKSTPFYVRFGKFQGVLKRREKVVNVSVNGVEANFCMYLDHRGQAYFLHEKEVEELVSEADPMSMFSPGGSSGDEGSRTVPQLLLETPSGNYKEATPDDLGSLKKGQGLVLDLEGGDNARADDRSAEEPPTPKGEDTAEGQQETSASEDLTKDAQQADQGDVSEQPDPDLRKDGSSKNGRRSSLRSETQPRTSRGFVRASSCPPHPHPHPSPAEVELRSVLSMSPNLEGKGYNFQDTDVMGGGAKAPPEMSPEEQAILERDRTWRKVVRKAARAVEASPPLLQPPVRKEGGFRRSSSWNDLSRRTSEEDAVMQEHPDKASWGWGSWWYKSPPEGDHPELDSRAGSSHRSSYKTGDDENPNVNDPKEVILGFESARQSFADFGMLNHESEGQESRSQQPPPSIFGRLFGAAGTPPATQTPVRKLQRTESQEGFSRRGGKLDVHSDFQEDLDGVLKRKMVWGPVPEEKEEDGSEPGQDLAGSLTTGLRRGKQGLGSKRDEREVEAVLSSLADDLLKEKGPEEGGVFKEPKRVARVVFEKEGLQGIAHRTSSGGFSDAPGTRLRGSFPKIEESTEGERDAEKAPESSKQEEGKSERDEGKSDKSETPLNQRLDPRYQSRAWKRHLSRKDSESDGDDIEIDFARGGHALEASILMAELEEKLMVESPEEEQRTEERLREQPLRLWDGMDLAEAVAALKNSVGGEEGARLEELLRKKSTKWAEEDMRLRGSTRGANDLGTGGVEKSMETKKLGVLSRSVRSRLKEELAAQFIEKEEEEDVREAGNSSRGGEEAEAEFLEKQRRDEKLITAHDGPSAEGEQSGEVSKSADRTEAQVSDTTPLEPEVQLRGFDAPPSLSSVKSAPMEIPSSSIAPGGGVDGFPDIRRAASLPGPSFLAPSQGVPFSEIKEKLQLLESSSQGPRRSSGQSDEAIRVSGLQEIFNQPLSQSAPVSGFNTPLLTNPDPKPVTEPGTTQSTPPRESPARSLGKPPLGRSPLVKPTGLANPEESRLKSSSSAEGLENQGGKGSGEGSGHQEEPASARSLHGEEVSDASDPLRAAIVEGRGADTGAEGMLELKDAKVETAMELSLCRHLLLPGMGTEAAASAFESEAVSFEKFLSGPQALITNERLVCRVGGRYYPWKVVAPTLLGMLAFGRIVPTYSGAEYDGAIPVEKQEAPKPEGEDAAQQGAAGWRLWPFTSRGPGGQRPPTPEGGGTQPGTTSPEPTEAPQPTLPKPTVRRKRKCKLRTLIPTSEELASFNLNYGQNKITFAFTTRVWGKQEVDATIHLWKWNSRVIISDVDGTITKSDLMGQIAPLIGRDWSQSGVASLFSSIKENGYEFMYLSARAISQSATTRAFLSGIRQDGKSLPDGPIVISPDGMIPSLYREVIRRTPHEFKIACLNEIRALFPPNSTPFYAGFGNRDTDEISYLAVGIARGKIFTINPKGEVVANKVSVDVCGYSSMRQLVHDMFPSVNRIEQEDYNSWNYWKIPVPEIDDDELLEGKKREEEGRKKEEIRKKEDAKRREEQKRKDELRRKEEEKRRVDEARKKKVEDDKRKREEDLKRREDEKKRVEEEGKRKREEDKRKKEEDKKRVEEERRKGEEDRKKKVADDKRRREDEAKRKEAEKKRVEDEKKRVAEEKRLGEVERRWAEGARKMEEGESGTRRVGFESENQGTKSERKGLETGKSSQNGVAATITSVEKQLDRPPEGSNDEETKTEGTDVRNVGLPKPVVKGEGLEIVLESTQAKRETNLTSSTVLSQTVGTKASARGSEKSAESEALGSKDGGETEGELAEDWRGSRSEASSDKLRTSDASS